MLETSESSQMIREALIDMCRPFGTIESWQVQDANEGLYRCSVKLHDADPYDYEEIAQKLGAEWNGEELRVEIRVRK